MATTLEKLASTKALGDIRQLASQTRRISPTAADGVAGLQSQIDTLLGLTQGSASELRSAVDSITPYTDADAIAAVLAAGYRKITVVKQTLTAATTTLTNADPGNTGEILFFHLQQDITGGRKITWDTNLIGATAQLGVDLANTRYLFGFVGLDLGSGPKWVSFLVPVSDF